MDDRVRTYWKERMQKRKADEKDLFKATFEKETKDPHMSYKLAQQMGKTHTGFKRRKLRGAVKADTNTREWYDNQAATGPEGGCSAADPVYYEPTQQVEVVGLVRPTDLQEDENEWRPAWGAHDTYHLMRQGKMPGLSLRGAQQKNYGKWPWTLVTMAVIPTW